MKGYDKVKGVYYSNYLKIYRGSILWKLHDLEGYFHLNNYNVAYRFTLITDEVKSSSRQW